MTEPAAVEIYKHDATSILPALAAHLPHSATVVRRIQHGLAYPSSSAEILATFAPGTPAPEQQPWLAARVDLFRGRETQMVVYSSLEAEHTSNLPITGSDHIVSVLDASPSALAQVRAQLLALLTYIKTHLLPSYLSFMQEAKEKEDLQTHNGVPLIPAPDPHAFLIGSLHTGLFTLLQREPIYSADNPLPGIKVHRFDNPAYSKYSFPQEIFSSGSDSALPSGYRYQDRRGRVGLLPAHLDLVQSRTHIPRSSKSLSTMPGVAVYHDPSSASETIVDDRDEMPIAWAFLGTDGALATLHVEPEHRGRGLALRLSKEVMRRGMAPGGLFGADSVEIPDYQDRLGGWVHTEVAQYNHASRRVMEKIGGKPFTTVTWTVIELVD
ncbi:Acyl-CoA N-acyltransferase [Penicillium lagena]|uniref:Acyl-CoA N-acyltransferase n=1 Tax=Penicillium lagena TaxID=94218 RepID=UPI002540761A|nr:Acyl-CoA N-acyltransferase [Penicillium lagena]KAJ5624306.1 Acyl-CoA N-acyltransferase [Penicillium lagena]